VEDPLPWSIHFEYPLDEFGGGGDPEWLPDGMTIEGYSTIEGAIAAWPDLDTWMVNP
jgi:hypothetical protein